MKLLFTLLISIFAFTSNAQTFDTLILIEEDFILFNSGEWKLDRILNQDMDSLIIKAATFDHIILEGHTDEVGSLDFNQKLSNKRVSSVKAELLNLGVEEEKIRTLAFGELKPLQSGTTESNYQMNRRVSVKFYQSIKMRSITGKVVDKKEGEGIEAKIKLTGKNYSDSTYSDINGRYIISAPDKAIYKMEVNAEDYFFEQRFIKVSPVDSTEIGFELPKIEIGGVYTLPNFNFKGDLPILLESSIPTLDLLFDLLSKSTFCVEIEGHINLPNQPACKIGTKHHKLSVDRAEMVFRSMVNKGISPARMLPKGYGNWQMLFPKTNQEKEMRENRRVEIKFIDCETKDLIDKK